MFLTKLTATLLALIVLGAATAREREAPQKEPAFKGTISAIAEDGKSVTVTSGGRGEQPKMEVVKLDAQSKIEGGGILKDLITKPKVGDMVSVWLKEGSKDTAAVVQLSRAADVTGKITAADAKSFTVETASRTGAEKVEIKLTEQTKMGGRGETKLAVGQTASVWLQEGSKDTAAAVQIAPPPGQPRQK